MLATLARQIATALEADLPTLKGPQQYKSVESLKVKIAVDPTGFIEKQHDGIYIVPMTNEYLIAESLGRGRPKTLNIHPVIGMIMLVSYISTSSGDVGEWDESEDIMDFRERLERHIATTDWGFNLRDVVSEPPMEAKLDQRNFMGVTEFTFEGFSC